MLQTKKIGNGLCAVAYEPTEIMVRSCGRENFGKEKTIAKVVDGKLLVFESALKEFGIEVMSSEEYIGEYFKAF